METRRFIRTHRSNRPSLLSRVHVNSVCGRYATLVRNRKLIMFIISDVYIMKRKIEISLEKYTKLEELYILEKKKYTSILKLFTTILINLNPELNKKYYNIRVAYNKNNLL